MVTSRMAIIKGWGSQLEWYKLLFLPSIIWGNLIRSQGMVMYFWCMTRGQDATILSLSFTHRLYSTLITDGRMGGIVCPPTRYSFMRRILSVFDDFPRKLGLQFVSWWTGRVCVLSLYFWGSKVWFCESVKISEIVRLGILPLCKRE